MYVQTDRRIYRQSALHTKTDVQTNSKTALHTKTDIQPDRSTNSSNKERQCNGQTNETDLYREPNLQSDRETDRSFTLTLDQQSVISPDRITDRSVGRSK